MYLFDSSSRSFSYHVFITYHWPFIKKTHGPSTENLKDEMNFWNINWLHGADLNTRDPFWTFSSKAAGTGPLSLLLDKSLQKTKLTSYGDAGIAKLILG